MIANQWKKYSKFNKLEKNLKRIQLGYRISRILSKFTFPSKVKSDLRVNTNITINVI